MEMGSKILVEGQRVRVAIARPSEWTKGAYERLNGLEGVVEDTSGPTDRWGREREPVYTVRFDAPTEQWSAFHFEAADLFVL